MTKAYFSETLYKYFFNGEFPVNKILSLILFFFITSFSSHAASLSYCKNVKMTQKEQTLLQELIVQFAKEMHCEIAANCITQWDIKDGQAKYSIAWQQQCGPVIKGQYQLGDEGHGSTFVCNQNTGVAGKQTCCWPLGYDYHQEYVKCMD